MGIAGRSGDGTDVCETLILCTLESGLCGNKRFPWSYRRNSLSRARAFTHAHHKPLNHERHTKSHLHTSHKSLCEVCGLRLRAQLLRCGFIGWVSTTLGPLVWRQQPQIRPDCGVVRLNTPPQT